MCHVSDGANYELPSIPLTTFLPTLVRYSLYDVLIIQMPDIETNDVKDIKTVVFDENSQVKYSG